MADYTPNSHKYREEQKEAAAGDGKKKIEKVIKGMARTKKKSEIRKFTDIFVSEDARNVKDYIFMDVLVPAIKKALSDIVKEGIDMLLYGGTGGSKRNGNASYVSYRDYSNRNRNDIPVDNYRTRSGYSYDDIILDSRGEAEEVIDRMCELIEMYGMVSVADMYDLVGKSGEYTDNKYGWTNLRNAEPVRVRDGYLLRLPKAGPIG